MINNMNGRNQARGAELEKGKTEGNLWSHLSHFCMQSDQLHSSVLKSEESVSDEQLQCPGMITLTHGIQSWTVAPQAGSTPSSCHTVVLFFFYSCMYMQYDIMWYELIPSTFLGHAQISC